MRSREGRCGWVVLALLALACGDAAAQFVFEPIEDIDLERPEAWAMAYFTSLTVLTGLGAPQDLRAGGVEIGLEGSWVPSLDEDERRVGFNGMKVEDLNRTSIFGRLRLGLGLPHRMGLTLAWAPPVELDGAEPSVVSLAFGGRIARASGWDLGLRGFRQHGRVRGDFTCTAEEAGAGVDVIRNPFNCESASRDRVTQNYAGVELGAAWRGTGRGVSPHLALSIQRLDMEFQVDARYAGLIDRTLLRADGWTAAGAVGIRLPLSARLRLAAEAFYTPLDVVRPPHTSTERDGLLHVRALVGWRLR